MKVTYYLANYATLSSVPVQAGNMIFSQNEKKIYVDGPSGRVAYDSIMYFNTEAQRLAKRNPIPGFYFVKETHKLWYFENEWACLSATDEPEKEIIADSYDNFPAIGEKGKLYIDGTNIYVWDETTEDYIQASSSGSGSEEWIEV